MTEADLCSQFMAAARARGWRVMPECGGWDILMERPDGLQVGIQAKLQANLAVLAQALEPRLRKPGPDVYAVLIPGTKANHKFGKVAAACGIAVVWAPFGGSSWDFTLDNLEAQAKALPLREHAYPAWMPDVPSVLLPAGVPGPSQVTAWKVRAVRLARLLRAKGALEESDFKGKRERDAWVQNGWVRGVKRPDHAWAWGPVPGMLESKLGLPDRRWPEIALAVQQAERDAG